MTWYEILLFGIPALFAIRLGWLFDKRLKLQIEWLEMKLEEGGSIDPDLPTFDVTVNGKKAKVQRR